MRRSIYRNSLSSILTVLAVTLAAGCQSSLPDPDADATGNDTANDTTNDSVPLDSNSVDTTSGTTLEESSSALNSSADDAANLPQDDVAYSFKSQFTENDSVSYGGQSFRHVLIADLKSHIGELTGRLDDGSLFPAAGDVTAGLDFYLNFDSEIGGQLPHTADTEPSPLQSVYDDIGSDKDLRSKLAGNDDGGQHKDWKTDFVGWDDSATNPEALVLAWFEAIDSAAADRANGTIPTDPSGNPIAHVFLSSEGRDYQQLIHKFLLAGITFSQGCDDYLDDDIEGAGLNSDNTEAKDEGADYTALEHGWDEGFGYFGAARDYDLYTDEELAAKGGRDDFASGYHDTNGDGSIDLIREFNFGHSLNAAKRDLGASADAPTDFSTEAFGAFVNGRKLITQAGGALSEEQMTLLKEHRDAAVLNWEKAIAATVVHYINDVLKDMATFGTEEYDFAGHAKHWSELKGFALSFQFNPRSPMSGENFVALHALLGTAPALPDSGNAETYKADLIAARQIIADTYEFASENTGDEDGNNGW